MSSGDRIIKNTRSDKDLVFNVNDGGTQKSTVIVYGASEALGLKDTAASYFLKLITTNTGIAADRSLTINIKNADKSLILGGDINLIGGLSTITTGGTSNSLTIDLNNGDRTLDFSGTFNVEGDSVINQDLSSDSTTAQFATLTASTSLIASLLTKDSADLKLTTTTSGDVELNPVSTLVRVMGDTANNSGTKSVLFGNDGNGTDLDNSAGIRTSSSGAIQYKDRAGSWTAISAGSAANQALSNLASVAINTSLISDTDITDDLGSSAKRWKELFTQKVNGIEWLSTTNLLSSGWFPNTTNLFGWNAFAQGTLANADWIGSEDLVAVGTAAYAADHLGTSNNALDIDGSSFQAAYINSATFDTADESFTAGGWYKFDDLTDKVSLISKYSTTAAQKSFDLAFSTSLNGQINLDVYYNSSSGYETVKTPVVINSTSKWYHIVAVYNQTDKTILIYINGSCCAAFYSNNLATRNNNSTAKLGFGCTDPSGTPANLGNLKMADFFYKKSALTSNEIRKVYAAGSSTIVHIDINSKVVIQDGRKNDGFYYQQIPSYGTLSTSAYASITGSFIIIPEDGLYRVKSKLSFLNNAGSTDSQVDYRLFAETCYGSGVEANPSISANTVAQSYLKTVSGGYFFDTRVIEFICYLNKGNNIRLQCSQASGGSCNLYTSSERETSIEWEKLD